MSEREQIVAWLRKEGWYARQAQAHENNETDKIYRMGQKDAYLLASDAIERGDHIKND